MTTAIDTALLQQARTMHHQLSAWRRHLHAHPELSGQEQATAAYVAEELRKIGLTPQERVGGGFGLTATIAAPRDAAPLIALRADMDALPINEETGLEFASRNPGIMHACGHDAHTAMLLGAARLLQHNRQRLACSVRLIFQPHEELFPGGAPQMIAAGALDGASSIFGLHISSTLPTGQVGTRAGAFMSAINDIDITIRGKGGHAAMPEQCVDPIVIAAEVILALQTAVSRSIPITEPAVVSVTRIEAGTANNIIPESVRLLGTIRTFSEQVRATICTRVRELAGGVARSHGATASVSLEPGYPVLNNDTAATERALRAARSLGFNGDQIQTLQPQGGGEDFAYYCQKTPGSFVFLGAASAAKQCVYPHHHPKFNIDEDALPSGAALLAQYALDDRIE
jgi:amidohydrolase